MKKYSVTGISAVAIYSLTIIVGGILRPEYTLFVDPASRIFARGLPLSWLIVLFLVISNILIIYLAYGILRSSTIKLIRASMIFLIIASIVGCILFVFFPMDPWLGFRTAADIAHNNIVTVMVALIFISMLLLYLGSRNDKRWQKLSNYFLLTTVIYFLASATAGYCLHFLPSLTGTFESLWIIIFLQWIVVMSINFKPR